VSWRIKRLKESFQHKAIKIIRRITPTKKEKNINKSINQHKKNGNRHRTI